MTPKRHLVNTKLNNSWSLTFFPVFSAFLYWPRSLLPTGYLISVLYIHSCRCRKRILFRCLLGSDSEYQQVKLFSGSPFAQVGIWDLGLHHLLQFRLLQDWSCFLCSVYLPFVCANVLTSHCGVDVIAWRKHRDPATFELYTRCCRWHRPHLCKHACAGGWGQRKVVSSRWKL